jgi:hypothetical protein
MKQKLEEYLPQWNNTSTADYFRLWQIFMYNFGNSSISYGNETSFLMELCGYLEYAYPLFHIQNTIQEKIRGMNDDEIREGGLTISNYASNPNNEPVDKILHYVSSQSTNDHVGNKFLQLYSYSQAVEAGYWVSFIRGLRRYFKQYVSPDLYGYREELE